jgi:AP-1 complex subunit beta-1
VNQQTLSPRLLDELISELGSLASVYHKPKESFVGKGKFGADDVQRRAIEYLPVLSDLTCREQIQNARENPIQAQSKSNVENLLDLDLTSTTEVTSSITVQTGNILDDLGSLSMSSSPVPPASQIASPLSGAMSPQPTASPTATTNNMADLLGVFSSQSSLPSGTDIWGSIPTQESQKQKSTTDILGLF